jgi:hypothetical protein
MAGHTTSIPLILSLEVIHHACPPFTWNLLDDDCSHSDDGGYIHVATPSLSLRVAGYPRRWPALAYSQKLVPGRWSW